MEEKATTFSYDEVQHAIEEIQLEDILKIPKTDFENMLNIIYNGDYGTESIENLTTTIKTLQQIIDSNNHKSQEEHKKSNDFIESNDQINSQKCLKAKEKIDKKNKAIINVLIHLGCNKISDQRNSILSKFYDINCASLSIPAINDVSLMKSSVDQFFNILELNEQDSIQIMNKAKEYIDQNSPEIAKEYLKFNINICDFEIYDVGNICFFKNLISQIQLAEIITKFPKFKYSFSTINFVEFSTKIINSIKNAKIESDDFQKLTEMIEKLRSIINKNEDEIQNIKQKQTFYEENENIKMEKHYAFIFQCFSKCNEIFEKICSEMQLKMDSESEESEN